MIFQCEQLVQSCPNFPKISYEIDLDLLLSLLNYSMRYKSATAFYSLVVFLQNQLQMYGLLWIDAHIQFCKRGTLKYKLITFYRTASEEKFKRNITMTTGQRS